MTFDELKALDHAHTLQTYGRFDVDVDHGQGATLWDLAGRTYIDFTSGIGVCSVGYGNEKWARAIYDQALALGHISNLFYSQPYARLAGALCARSGMAAAFFGNSGAEANEGLLKLARKYSHDKYGAGRGTILTLRNSFHGRTLATLAATGQDVFHQHFFPFPEGFRHTGANDLADVEAQAGEDVCAVLLELVQGEGGVLPMDRDFVRALAGLCEQRDWLLLVDSDDWIEPQTLEKTMEAGLREEADLVMFAYRSVDEGGHTLRTFLENVPKERGMALDAQPDMLLTSPSAWCRLYRRELLERTGILFPPRVWYEDMRTTPKLLAEARQVVYLDYVGYNYLSRTGSITKNQNAARNREIVEAFDDLLPWFQRQGLFEKYRQELCLSLIHI